MPIFDLFVGIATIYLRVLPVFLLVPVFSSSTISNRYVRGSFTFIFCMPFLDVLVIPDIVKYGAMELFLSEVIIGLLIALPTALPFYIATAIGELIDNQRGATLSNSIDPSVGVESSPLSSFFIYITNVLFLTSPGILLLIHSINDSYVKFPYGEVRNLLADNMDSILQIADKSLMAGVYFVLPVLLIMFLTEVFLGVLSRFSPQMNSFSLSLTVKSIIGIGMLFTYFYKIYPDYIQEYFIYVW
ncbi:MAG: type III secretion system export apparatus subunit SctT [Enterovibrio sp.]